MIEVNLIPDVKLELIKAQKMRNKVISITALVGLASVATVVVLAFYVFGVQALRGSLADTAINNNIEKLKKVEDLDKTLTIQNQLVKITGLNKSKKISSRLFDLLNSVIPPAPNDIQISLINVDTVANVVHLEGQALNSYPAVEIFKKTLENAILDYKDQDGQAQQIKLINDIVVSNTSYGQDLSGRRLLGFSMGFSYAPELFDQASKGVNIKVNVNGDVTDSYINIPKSIFADKVIEIKKEK